jgi:glyoxylase-like metal-dependent hydrolase (beta-lactamase superfamily II)
MDTLFGEFLAAPAQHVYAHHDGDVIEAGGLRFIAHDTPGHASHHFVFQLDDIAFTGDIGGMRLPEHPHLHLPTPPPEFELDVWLDSVARMRALDFTSLYMTHFGEITPPAEHWDRVSALLPLYADRVRAGLEAGHDRGAVVADMEHWEEDRLRGDGVDEALWPIYGSMVPASMSADGLLRYWTKRGYAG